MSTPKSSMRQLLMKNRPSPLASGIKFSTMKMATKPKFAIRQGTFDCAVQKSRLPMTINGNSNSSRSGIINVELYKSSMG